jgi:hypothetical protein
MSPNSNERANWIQERLDVLGACRKDLSRRAAYYHQSLGATPQTVHDAVQLMRAEELALTVELSVHNTRIAANLEAALAAQGVSLPPVQP